MDRSDYIQGVTRTKVLETRLLSRAKLDRMIDANNINEVIKILNETEYSNAIAGISRGEEYEKILSNEIKRVFQLMREITKDQVVVDLVALKYDYHNLKVLIKEKEYNKDFSQVYMTTGTINIQRIKSAYLENDYNDIYPEFKAAIEAVTLDFKNNKDPQRIELIIDRFYFEHLYKMAKQTKIELFINYVKDMIDFINIKSAIRLKKQGKDFRFFEDVILENGNIERDEILSTFTDSIDNMISKFRNSKISTALLKGLEAFKNTNRLSDFEKYMDNYLMDINKQSKNINIGPEPIFSYLVAKEAEIKTLRIIMVSKLNNLSPNVIREKVRDLYV